ncbi:MAG: 3-dehydroquinate synthase [Phycisphaeraceae bacterium]|nr:3-dehydroquinate synthase [Phycisphaeraceae bacterium]
MPTVEVILPHHRYEVLIQCGALDQLGPQVHDRLPHRRCALILDQAIATTHGRQAADSLRGAGYEPLVADFATSEPLKSLDTVAAMLSKLAGDRIERKSPLVAMGGGILTDTAGFAAACWLRGVPLVMVPTTLLSMVDAAVGGKVGVNLPQGKNLVGAFHQPSLVLIDPNVLATLPQRELRCGLAECIKHAIIRDPDLWTWTSENLERVLALDPGAMQTLIARNVAIKAAVVMADEREAGERAHLNFGHTFAHAIEAAQTSTPDESRYHHGEAVALGMIAATTLAVLLDRADRGMLDELIALLDRAGLPVRADNLAPTARLMELMKLDKKVSDDRIRLILPRCIGEVEIDDSVPTRWIERAWDSIRA